MEGWWRWALVSPDGVVPSRMFCVSASVNLPLHHKVQKFSSDTGSPGCTRKKGCKTVVVWLWWCGVGIGHVGSIAELVSGLHGLSLNLAISLGVIVVPRCYC